LSTFNDLAVYIGPTDVHYFTIKITLYALHLKVTHFDMYTYQWSIYLGDLLVLKQ